MGKSTQAQIDQAYREGKATYFRDIGTHGPSLKHRVTPKTENPYPCDSKQWLAWQRGYGQDTRRVIETND